MSATLHPLSLKVRTRSRVLEVAFSDGSQFDLPFARYPRGEYQLEIRATAGAERVTQLLTIRVRG